MTKIAIVPNAAGTGTFTIEAPNSNSNRTLTLPDAAGELLTDVSDLPAANLTGDVAAARITTALNAGGSAPVYACRAWVNFDGTTATPSTIRGSGNVSSVTRNGTGDYTVNFTNAMPDANYSLTGTATRAAAGGVAPAVISSVTPSSVFNTASVRFDVIQGTSKENSLFCCVAIFR